VDFSRSVHYRAEFQGVADSEALAATDNYIAAGVAMLPGNGRVTKSVVPVAVATGYQVTVTLTSSVPTIFLGKAMPSLAMTVTSVALNPHPYGHFCAGAVDVATGLCDAHASAFSASAADTNTVYWYKVSSNGGIPADADMTQLWTNKAGVTNNPAPIPLEAGDKIGCAMRNTIGNYGSSCTGSRRNRVFTANTNQYGSQQGQTHTFCSHLVPPTNSSKGYTSSNNGAAVPPSNGSCRNYSDAAATLHAAPSCGQLGAKVITFYWNDMGGTTDDRDYNDAVYTYYCITAAPTAPGSAARRGRRWRGASS
jgi:hypothetical protein